MSESETKPAFVIQKWSDIAPYLLVVVLVGVVAYVEASRSHAVKITEPTVAPKSCPCGPRCGCVGTGSTGKVIAPTGAINEYVRERSKAAGGNPGGLQDASGSGRPVPLATQPR